MEGIFSELARLFDGIKRNEKDEILHCTKVLSLKLKQVNETSDFGAEKLAFIYNKPFQAVINQNSPSSTIVLDSIELYTSLIQKCRFKSPREVVSHFAWVPSFSEKIGQEDEPVIEALTSYLKFLFTIQCPDSEAYRYLTKKVLP